MEKSWLENNTLIEAKRNSDYPKFVKLFYSENPKYCFATISACRGLPKKDSHDRKIKYTQRQIDANNERNNVKTYYLEHQLRANGFGIMRITGYYPEKDAGFVEETSYLVYTSIDDFTKLKSVVEFLAEEYEQESVMFIDPNHKCFLTNFDYSRNVVHKTQSPLGEVDFGKYDVKKAYSLLGSKKTGRKFAVKDIKAISIVESYHTELLHESLICPRYEKFDEPGYLDAVKNAFKNMKFEYIK